MIFDTKVPEVKGKDGFYIDMKYLKGGKPLPVFYFRTHFGEPIYPPEGATPEEFSELVCGHVNSIY